MTPDRRGAIGRRAFLGLAGAALALRLEGALGQGAKPPRIGWLTSSVLHTRNLDAFRQEMRTLGHRDLRLEVRAAEGKIDRLPELAAQLAALPVDGIVTDGGPAIVAAKRATGTIPIVIGAAAIDLVRQGLVESLARPGGNVTGFLISTGAELGPGPRRPAGEHPGPRCSGDRARARRRIPPARGRDADAGRRLLLEPARSHRGAGGPAAAARDVRGAGVRRIRRPDGVRTVRGPQLPTRGGLRGSHPPLSAPTESAAGASPGSRRRPPARPRP